MVENCPTYYSIAATKYVLEVNAGFVEKNKISIGDFTFFLLMVLMHLAQTSCFASMVSFLLVDLKNCRRFVATLE